MKKLSLKSKVIGKEKGVDFCFIVKFENNKTYQIMGTSGVPLSEAWLKRGLMNGFSHVVIAIVYKNDLDASFRTFKICDLIE